jgi:hypothetical protein
MNETQTAASRIHRNTTATSNQESTTMNAARSFVSTSFTTVLPANDQGRSSRRKSQLRAQLKVESIRYANACRRLQSVVDSAELLRELESLGSNTSRHYPSVVARVVRAVGEEEDRIFHIGVRVSALRAQMEVYQ